MNFQIKISMHPINYRVHQGAVFLEHQIMIRYDERLMQADLWSSGLERARIQDTISQYKNVNL